MDQQNEGEMMDDRELLKLAANAAGMMFIDDRESGLTIQRGHDGCPYNYAWNPLTDDGDAMRLAVKLRLTLLLEIPRIGIGPALPGVEMYVDEGEDEYAATRRAIVRAAAELARAGAQKG